MNKPKLLYASPFWPKKSGISEYSEVLVYGLSEFYDVTLLLEDYSPTNKRLLRDFQIINYQHGKRYTGFNAIIYNIGNNPEYHSYMAEAMQANPGYIILHDFVLYYLTVGTHQRLGDVFQTIYALEGVRGIGIVKDSLKKMKESDLLLHKSIAALLPLNEEIIRMAKGVFVHSDYARNLLHDRFPELQICKIELIKMSFVEPYSNFRKETARQYRIPENAYVTGSIGFIAPTKQNEECCKAIKRYNETHIEKIYYLMVGEGDYVDSYLDEFIIKTGFVKADEYLQAITRCDLIFNLRYPTNGESSATLIQCMGYGKPCVVTDIGWFGELPEGSVKKVRWDVTTDELAKVIDEIKYSDNSLINNMALEYVEKRCNPKNVAERMKVFIAHFANVNSVMGKCG